MRCKEHRNGAFTRIELLVVGLILVILVGAFLPQMIRKKRTSELAACVANLKQVGLGELLWINDNEKSRYSWLLATNEGGTLEYLEQGKLFPHFRALSNELVTPAVLICPADNRIAAKSFSTLGDSHLSYFMNMDPESYTGPIPLEKAYMRILFGNRNITNSSGSQRGIINVSESNLTSLGWSSAMHNNGGKPAQASIGNVAYNDGTVATLSPTNLQSGFKYLDTRLALP